jgi:hypothetical protein
LELFKGYVKVILQKRIDYHEVSGNNERYVSKKLFKKMSKVRKK